MSNFYDYMSGYRSLINKRIAILALAVAALGGLYYLINSETYAIPETAVKALNLFLFSGIAVLAVNLILKLTENRFFSLFEGQLDIEERIFITKIYSFALYSIALTVILSRLGLSIQNLTIFLGLIATGLAFAVRDIIVSYLVWFIILTKKPFRINDFIQIGEESGIVERIGTIFITVLPAFDEPWNIRKIPNKLILERPISNYGSMCKPVNIRIKLKDLPADSDKRIEKCKTLLNKLLKEDEHLKIYYEYRDDSVFLVISGKTAFDRSETIITKIYKTASGCFSGWQKIQ